MRYLKLFESFDESKIHEICSKYNIKDYTINSDGSIDIDGYVNLRKSSLLKIPLKFNKVNSWFSCAENILLKSLEGSPKEVNEGFYCNNNKLTSFQYAPKIIRGYFHCENNNIKSFEFFPRYVGGSFYCFGNPINEVWDLFRDGMCFGSRSQGTAKIELLNDFDIFRDEDTDEPAIIMDRLNDFLLTIGRDPVEKVKGYKNI